MLYVGISLLVLSVLVRPIASPHLIARATAETLVVFALIGGVSFVLVDLHSRVSQGLFESITLFFAVAALVFAGWQFRDARVQESRMEFLTGSLEAVAQSMSTRFVGFFPKNLSDINDIVLHANQSLDIMTDYVGYGHYSAPDDFESYRMQLEKLANHGVPIRLLVYTRGAAQRTHGTQFLDQQFCGDIVNRDEKLVRFCHKFRNTGFCKRFNAEEKLDFDTRFCGRLDPTQNPLPPSEVKKLESSVKLNSLKVEFDDLIFSLHTSYMTELLQRGVMIRETEALPFFLWSADDHEAVISFLNEASKQEREVSFRTRDASLVDKTFRVRFEDAWNRAKPIKLIHINNQDAADWGLSPSP
jgi:hypothetical protein